MKNKTFDRIEYQRQYRLAHRKEQREYNKDYRRTHNKKIKAYQASYWRDNKAKLMETRKALKADRKKLAEAINLYMAGTCTNNYKSESK